MKCACEEKEVKVTVSKCKDCAKFDQNCGFKKGEHIKPIK